MASEAEKKKILIIPGMGCTPTLRSNWYRWVKQTLESHGYHVLAPDMPDPHKCRMGIWLSFIMDTLKCDDQCLIVGHSTGAIAIMRLLEQTRVKGAILVAAYHTDLGCAAERASGYFRTAWDWQKMKSNADFIVQFASTDDELIPISEARHVGENLATEYLEFTDQMHFYGPEFPQLIEKILEKFPPN
eukprot:TRINITY_DN6649_c0_g1_i3.p1 TRINITY_DN6649_c0_g1~~TRINITY_DN6649_c0_g1_i3.p1  ORF type:complete len:208 (-),score=35.65 TRINITY_DN6649_c0_g1_i3:45-608(-)